MNAITDAITIDGVKLIPLMDAFKVVAPQSSNATRWFDQHSKGFTLGEHFMVADMDFPGKRGRVWIILPGGLDALLRACEAAPRLKVPDDVSERVAKALYECGVAGLSSNSVEGFDTIGETVLEKDTDEIGMATTDVENPDVDRNEDGEIELEFEYEVNVQTQVDVDVEDKDGGASAGVVVQKATHAYGLGGVVMKDEAITNVPEWSLTMSEEEFREVLSSEIPIVLNEYSDAIVFLSRIEDEAPNKMVREVIGIEEAEYNISISITERLVDLLINRIKQIPTHAAKEQETTHAAKETA